jgi:hypothetical protein
MTPKQLKAIKNLALYWRRQLRITNWKFEIQVLPYKEGEAAFGQNEMDPNFEKAYITLRDPATMPKEVKGVRDIEVTLVHELLHTRLLYVAPISKKKKKKWMTEMCVETISQALVANRRGIDVEELK